MEVRENDEGIEEYLLGKEKITFSGNSICVSKKLMKIDAKKKHILFDSKILKKEDAAQGKGKKPTFAVPETDYTEEDGCYIFSVASFSYNKDDKSIKVSRVMSFSFEYHRESEGKYMLTSGKNSHIEIAENGKTAKFILDPSDKKERVRNIIHSIKNGMYFHTSGENTGIIPKYIVGAALTLPIPLFHSYVDLTKFNDSILGNDYILKGAVFCQNHMGSDTFDVKEAETNLDTFLNKIGLGEARDGKTNP